MMGRQWPVALAAVLIGMIVLGFWIWQNSAERRAILRMPVEQRQQAVTSTLRTLETLCGDHRADALEEYCEAQASFVLQFPECDQSCRQRALPLTVHPAR
jgi:cytochrome b pre-mRNA-processing protein 3